MAEMIAIQGVALAFVEREFQPFTAKNGEQVAGGVTRTLWLGTEFNVEPTQVKVPGDRAGLLAGINRGDSIVADCMIFASGNRLSYRLDSVKVTASK